MTAARPGSYSQSKTDARKTSAGPAIESAPDLRVLLVSLGRNPLNCLLYRKRCFVLLFDTGVSRFARAYASNLSRHRKRRSSHSRCHPLRPGPATPQQLVLSVSDLFLGSG